MMTYLIAEQASGLQDTEGREEPENLARDSQLPATLVRIPAEQRQKIGE